MIGEARLTKAGEASKVCLVRKGFHCEQNAKVKTIMAKRIQGRRWALVAFDQSDKVIASALTRFELWAKLLGREHARAGVVEVEAAEARTMAKAGVKVDDTTLAEICAQASCSRYTAKAAIRACISRGRGNLAHAESVGTDRSSMGTRPKGVQPCDPPGMSGA